MTRLTPLSRLPERSPRRATSRALVGFAFAALTTTACAGGGTEPNTPPVADLRADGLASAGALVTLDGTGSSDPGGNPLTYQWTQLSGPDVGTLAGVAAPSFTAPDDIGDLSFQLVVNNGFADSAPAEVRILVVRDRNRAVFLSPAGTTDGAGTQEEPISSLANALDEAASREADLYVAAGTWDETLVLRSGVSVFGGFDPEDWARDPSTHTTVIRSPTSGTFRFAMRGEGVQDLTVDGVRFEGEGPAVRPVLLSDATGVILSGISVLAPAGLDGVDGPNRSDHTGRAPGGIRGENSGVCGRAGGAGGSGSGGRNAGGRGGNGGAAGGFDGARGGNSGGHGGEGGSVNGGGSAGGSGGDRAAGSGGSGGAAVGSFSSRGSYDTSDGTIGGSGSPGRGGGGGGGGGGALFGVCGGGGGGGGAGGRGGPGGFGGEGGGASVAVLVVAGSDVRIVGSSFNTGGGGDGGNGGIGGDGEPGGNGAPPSDAGLGGGGGRGGDGGDGGRGGRGGGGGGGPSIGIFAVDSQLDESGNTFELGPAGAGGVGGENGAAGLRMNVYRAD